MITSAENILHQQATSQIQEGPAVRNRIAHWDPYELADKIKGQIDIEKLLEEKIIKKHHIEAYELTAYKDHVLNSPDHMQNEKTKAYVK